MHTSLTQSAENPYHIVRAMIRLKAYTDAELLADHKFVLWWGIRFCKVPLVRGRCKLLYLSVWPYWDWWDVEVGLYKKVVTWYPIHTMYCVYYKSDIMRLSKSGLRVPWTTVTSSFMQWNDWCCLQVGENNEAWIFMSYVELNVQSSNTGNNKESFLTRLSHDTGGL